MAIPSRVMAGGVSAGAAVQICGDTANALTATGSSNTDALQLSTIISRFTTTASGTGAKLPYLEPGGSAWVMNSGANALLVYPFAGAAINALTATTGGFSVAAAGRAMFVCIDDTRIMAILSA